MKFVLAVQENPSTGYVWDLHTIDPSVEVEGRFINPGPPQAQTQIGGPGIKEFTFTVPDDGEKHGIMLSKRRPWQSFDTHMIALQVYGKKVEDE